MPASHPLCVPKATREHPHQWEGVGSRRRVGLGAWGAASSFCLGFRNHRSHCLVSHQLPQTISPDPFLKDALQLPLKSHMGLGPRARLFSRMGEGLFPLVIPAPASGGDGGGRAGLPLLGSAPCSCFSLHLSGNTALGPRVRGLPRHRPQGQPQGVVLFF